MASADPELYTTNTENNSEMKKEEEEWILHRMAKVHNLLEMWQGSQNICATQKKSRAQNKQLTAVGYIMDTQEIVKALWSLFQHDGAAAFKLSERSPLPPPLSAKDLPGERTQVLNARRIGRISRHPVERDNESAPESISDTEDWLNWNGDIDHQNGSEDDCAADIESNIQQDNSIEDPERPDQRDVSTTPNIPRLIRPTWKSKRQVDNVVMTVNAIGTRRNMGA